MMSGDHSFTMTGRERNVLFGFMGLGLLCIVLTLIGDDAVHSRFWSNYLINAVFFTGVSFIALFIMAAFTTTYTGWYIVVKRIWEGYAQFLWVGLILMLVLIIGVWGHFHHLYHWADEAAVAEDPVLLGKSGFLNKYWYTFGTIIILGTWYFFFARPMRKLSLREDVEGHDANFSLYKKYKMYSAIFLPIGAFTSAAMIWQWVMSVDAHWYSTMFAWYTTASWFVACLAITIMLAIYLKGRGALPFVTTEHMHDLGKYLFAFSIFWTYLWFSQYMLIWYANVGEETIYFHTRINEYPVLFYGNLVLNFIVPFFVLMRNDTKRKAGTLFFVAFVVLLGRFLDFFQMVKPGVLHTTHEALAHHGEEAATEAAHHASSFTAGFTIPGLLEIGTFLGFLAFFIFFVFKQMEKAPLLPKNDPYLAESLHHHVQ